MVDRQSGEAVDQDAQSYNDELDGQLFSIRRSVRYHDRRLTHYDRLHRLTNVVTVMLAGVVMMDFLGKDVPLILKCVALVGAVLAACDLVVGFSRNANQHRNLKRGFIEIEKDLTEGTIDLRQLKSRRLVVESEEPAIFRALDVLCHIETCAAFGRPIEALVPWYMRVTSQWIHWSDAGTAAMAAYERREARRATKQTPRKL
jgi:hypothetical protein